MNLRAILSDEKTMKKVSLISTAFLFAVLIFMVFWFRGPQLSDAVTYIHLAKQSIAMNTFYPHEANIHDTYIFAPGFVNFLIVLFRITSNIKIVFVANIVFMCILLFSMRYIIIRLFQNRHLFYLFSVLFSFFPTYWGEIVSVRTEIPYTALAFLSFAVLLHDKKFSPFAAGILLALANWIRPLALAYFIAMLLYLFIKKAGKLKCFFLIAGFTLTILTIGFITYWNFGYFVFQSTTSGVNLIMGANDDADGSYDDTCFQQGKIAYLDSEAQKTMTFKEKDRYYRNLALEWIAKHPVKWTALLGAKLFVMYSADLYARTVFFQAAEDFSLASLVFRWIKGNIQAADIILIHSQILYMFIFVLFLVSVIPMFKKQAIASVLPLFSICFIGTAMTVIILGGARYHFPYLPIFMIFASWFIYTYFLKLNR
ncbi:MAG: hypothetical protein LBD48_02420 [Treponema sp.]|nr:hypothetical protein [Treponema sp.]